MKHSIKGLFVTLTIVMSFFLVQGVYALDPDDIESFTGTVTSVDETARSISLDVGDEDGNCVIGDGETSDVTTISHMGPSWYWQIPYPTECDILTIEAVKCDLLDEYVGVIVYDSDGNVLIQLRDIVTLKPLWNSKAKTTVLSDTAAEATGDGEPNDYSYYHDNDNDYNWKYEQPGPHKKDF